MPIQHLFACISMILRAEVHCMSGWGSTSVIEYLVCHILSGQAQAPFLLASRVLCMAYETYNWAPPDWT